MKQGKWGRIVSLTVILLSMVIVCCIAFGNQELTNVWDVIFTLDLRWLLACVGAMIVYVYAEGAGLYAFLRMEGYRVKLTSAAHFSFGGIYYANVTPSSTGGQPMQVYLMSQRKIPAGVATSALTSRYFFNQLSLVLITLGLWVHNRVYVAEHLNGVVGFVILGCVVNFFCVPTIIAIICNRPLVEKAVSGLIRLMNRLHICKKPEAWQNKADETIEHFHSSLMHLVHRPGPILIQLLTSVVEMLALMLVPYLVYRAMGMTGTSLGEVLTVSFMLFCSASYTPLPGASGAQEGGFLVYFGSVFGVEKVTVALLVWRFITYYGILILGCADSLWSSFRKRRAPIERNVS